MEFSVDYTPSNLVHQRKYTAKIQEKFYISYPYMKLPLQLDLFNYVIAKKRSKLVKKKA